MKKNILTGLILTGIIASGTFVTAVADTNVSSVNVTAEPTAYTLVINGNTVDSSASGIYKNEEHFMVPLRIVAETLGFTVLWDEENQGVRLDNGIVNTTVYIGYDSYYTASSTAIGMSAPTAIGAAPELIGDTTYVPADIFAMLLGDSDCVQT